MDWRRQLLRSIDAPLTKQNLKFLTSWQQSEGGHTNNSARFNWLNTTHGGPGATGSINSVGVKAFDTPAHGIQALEDTLLNGRYGDIVAGLRGGNPYAGNVSGGLSTWVSGSPTGNLGYASKVLGRKIDPQQVKVRAGEAFQKGPAAIVRGPSPAQAMLMKQQQVSSLLQMSQNTISGNSGQNWQIIQGLQQMQQQLAQAANQQLASESKARQYGGTTVPAGPSGRTFEGSSQTIQAVLNAADAQVGKPYVWGAESPKEGGFDCSGLIDWAFRQAGVKLPGGRLTTQTALKQGISVKGKPMQPGDWLITNGGEHMVMYVGHGQVIAAPHTGEVVQYQDVNRFANSIVDVRRVLK